MDLASLLSPHILVLISGADDSAKWIDECEKGAHPWLAWNFVTDSWFKEEHKILVETELARSAYPPDQGVKRLRAAAARLRSIRLLSPSERVHISAKGFTYLRGRNWRRFGAVMGGSNWLESMLDGERGSSTLTETMLLLPRKSRGKDQTMELQPRPVAPGEANRFWVTFETPGEVWGDPDVICTELGLRWQAEDGPMVRVEMQLTEELMDHLSIPTFFDCLACYRPWEPIDAFWRAVPDDEKASERPWGVARNLTLGGPSNRPEILVDLAASGDNVTATYVGKPKERKHDIGQPYRDWGLPR